MSQLLSAAGAETLALLAYPGLIALGVFGFLIEVVWSVVARRDAAPPNVRWRRPPTVQVIVALLAMLAAAQFAAPFNPAPAADRNLVIAAIAIGFTAWAELALDPELVARPGLLLVIQGCWLLSVLGPAIEPETLRPQVLGNVLVPGLLPIKVASALLYLLCLPALLRLWPVVPPKDRRTQPRIDAVRILCWLPYCGLFTTLFITPSSDDVVGVLRFFGITFAIAGLTIVAGFVLRLRGAQAVREMYTRAVAPYAGLVLAGVIATSVLMR